MRVALSTLALVGLADCAAPGLRAEEASGPPGREGRKFTLGQIRNERFHGHDLPGSFIKAHVKYGQGLPPQVSRALGVNPRLNSKFKGLTQAEDGPQRGTVEVNAPPDADSEFVVAVQMGNPAQSIPLNLDTGSSDLWTFSTDTRQWLVRGQVLYNARNSSTSRQVAGQHWQVRYGDGSSAAGIVYTDRVQVGGTCVEDQAVQAAVDVSPAISADSFSSGILGMANSAVNTVRPTAQRTYMDRVRDDLALPLFTANLQRGGPGNYNFGYINDSEHTGAVQYADVNPASPFWEISATGFQVGSAKDSRFIEAPGWNCIVDTGTSLLLVPDAVVERYYAQVRGSGLDAGTGMMVVPCAAAAAAAALPDFIVGIGEYRGLVPGEYISYAPANATHCFGGIQTSSGIPFGVLGDVLLKAQFVVFDFGAARIGFANKELQRRQRSAAAV